MENNLVRKSKVESYDIAKSDETLALAIDIAKFIKENKLYQNIQGKEYVNVEGWQYAGSRLGILPIVEDVVSLCTDTELKYQAKVTLLNLRNNLTCGAGFAVCSNKEQGKKYYQEFAISSMAQTRAIGKAYRNLLAWIIRAAGYEPTPAEEMDYTGNTPEVKAEVKPQDVPNTPKLSDTLHKQETNPNPDNGIQDNPTIASHTTEPSTDKASEKQKEEIIRLLNNSCITRQEKTKMLLNINKLDKNYAEQAITKLNKTIREREAESAAAV